MRASDVRISSLARVARNSARIALLLSAQLALSSAAMAGTASVVFVHPENFSDIGKWPRGPEAADYQAELSRHLQQLAARTLPDTQSLSIEVLDVDLAGRIEPMRRSGDEIRVMRGVTWPSIRLRFTLQQGGQVIVSGEETVADMDYQERPNPYPEGERLRYEKRMLDRWFQQRLVERQPAPR